MLTASVKIKTNILPNITFILKIFSENGIILSEWPYFLRSKSNVDFKETCFFKIEALCTPVNMRNILRHKFPLYDTRHANKVQIFKIQRKIEYLCRRKTLQHNNEQRKWTCA